MFQGEDVHEDVGMWDDDDEDDDDDDDVLMLLSW